MDCRRNRVCGRGTAELPAGFGEWPHLHVADGNASDHTIGFYDTHARQFVKWCDEQQVVHGTATEADLLHCRRHLVEH